MNFSVIQDCKTKKNKVYRLLAQIKETEGKNIVFAI